VWIVASSHEAKIHPSLCSIPLHRFATSFTSRSARVWIDFVVADLGKQKDGLYLLFKHLKLEKIYSYV
jgi:hypothetical protein